ncbi:hypothetical protein H2201_001302 [Coniosporium apollinis]|uniref:Gluconokinase n=2 Tax=Coniosporium TaxID=2810619 RepID=A0ABQ9P273_9PEZI|nr:hypothetical protein H2199_001712 [Cladosporium sp. JES 115]KAJ9668660.1 hypothetical protein H2201_001302 [Coniosporium apollinis]
MAPVDGTVTPSHHRHIWIITGPAGCGKSTVGRYLAGQLGFPYIEGDELHTAANIQKMASDIPLTDADRWDWLISLRQQAVAAFSTGATGVILTCSALKRRYRDVIRVAAYNKSDVLVHFVYLRATEDLVVSRVRARQGHYMKESMVRSQFQALEEPTEDETDVLPIDVNRTTAEVQTLALELVKEVMAQDTVEQSS